LFMLYSTSEPFKYNDPRETIGVMTDRTWAELSWAYGYNDIDELCSELPSSVLALDLGAGASNLGHAVGARRPDITWVNFDARYDDEHLSIDDREKIDRLRASAPPNVEYVGGNVLDLPTQIREQRFGRIFSYYMFPYVIDYFGNDVAISAMEDTLGLLTPDGLLSMGPIRYKDNGCWTVSLSNNTSIRSLATEMITRYTEPWEDVESRRKAELLIANS